MRQTRTVTDATFDAMVMHSTKPVVVDYWAGWCGPCPMIARSSRRSRPSTATVYNHGKLVKQLVGVKPKAELLKELAEFIGPGQQAMVQG